MEKRSFTLSGEEKIMQEELFEVIDASGKVVGTERRSIVHEKGLLHRASDVFVFDKKGRIFIQQRSFKKDIGPGLWDLSTTEHLKQCETFEAAAVRGVREELGVKAVNLEKLGETELHLKYSDAVDNEKKEVFKCGFKGRIKLDEREVEQGRWILKENLFREIAYSKELFSRWLVEDIKKFGALL